MKDKKLINTLCDLVKFKSITPVDDGIIKYISDFLSKLGFENEVKEFSSKKDVNGKEEVEKVLNLYSSCSFKQGGKNLCFAGHVDVVHPGKEFKWTYPPFEPTIENGVIYGRGTSDMKGAIAAYITALQELICEDGFVPSGTLSLLITGDEEGSGENGTKKMLQHLANSKIVIDDCIVGEPTNPDFVGQMVKNGRRGSITFFAEIEGKQGHIAYKQNFLNPAYLASQIVLSLKNHIFDAGNEFFDPTNLEIFKFSCESGSTNVVPQSASLGFNIRFCSLQTPQGIIKAVQDIINTAVSHANLQLQASGSSFKYSASVNHKTSGEAFLTNPDTHLAQSIIAAVKDVCGDAPVLSTSGGTSDARFIKDYARVVEFGSVNKTAHQIDECENIDGLIKLKNIYKKFIMLYFDN